jgi:hypothetical protein
MLNVKLSASDAIQAMNSVVDHGPPCPRSRLNLDVVSKDNRPLSEKDEKAAKLAECLKQCSEVTPSIYLAGATSKDYFKGKLEYKTLFLQGLCASGPHLPSIQAAFCSAIQC